jgi:hypothetical protein
MTVPGRPFVTAIASRTLSGYTVTGLYSQVETAPLGSSSRITLWSLSQASFVSSALPAALAFASFMLVVRP